MLVTSRTTEAGAGVTGVYDALVLFEPSAALTTTSTKITTTTSPTAIHAMTVPDSLRGARPSAVRLPGLGLGLFPPVLAAPPTTLPLPPGALVDTGRIWARLLSLALWPRAPAAARPPGSGLIPLFLF